MSRSDDSSLTGEENATRHRLIEKLDRLRRTKPENWRRDIRHICHILAKLDEASGIQPRPSGCEDQIGRAARTPGSGPLEDDYSEESMP